MRFAHGFFTARMILEKENVCLNIQQTFSVCDEAYELTGVVQGKHFVRARLGSIIIGFYSCAD